MNVATSVRVAADAALRSDAETVAAFGGGPVRVYAHTPPLPAKFPYIQVYLDVIGDDTECGEGAEVTLTLEVFARGDTHEASAQTVESIAGAIRKALVRKLPLDGHVVDDWTFEGDRPVGDPDVLTAHRSVSITYLTSASA